MKLYEGIGEDYRFHGVIDCYNVNDEGSLFDANVYGNTMRDLKREASRNMNKYRRSMDSMRVFDKTVSQDKPIFTLTRMNMKTPWGEWAAGQWK